MKHNWIEIIRIKAHGIVKDDIVICQCICGMIRIGHGYKGVKYKDYYYKGIKTKAYNCTYIPTEPMDMGLIY